MSDPARQKAVLQQVNQFWSMLDDMSQNNPEGYRTFIERQLREGTEYHSPPQPNACLRTSVLGSKEALLYINVCGWKRVPAPPSDTEPVPVCGGRLEMESEGNEQYSVLDVAFSPDVLMKIEKNKQEQEQLYVLTLRFAQQQFGLSLSQHYIVTKDKMKGSLQNMKRRLMLSPQQPNSFNQNSKPDPAPSLLQQIFSLRQAGNEGDTSIQLSVDQEDKQSRSGLIEVISSTDTAQPQQPNHHLSVTADPTGTGKSLQLTVELPGVSSVSQCQLRISQDDILLEVEDLYHLHLQLPETVNEETCTATFNKKKHTLHVKVSVL
ncbi:PIH1 domain-containing protein 2 [Chanos chanos]|uniref:PIH1 domain-containing protein 2 n=1 Tax=Chanos chanos TaxID=29144 RepID=A0A6J2VPH0_CHACN|nr:PIH1 domain-containing protein 2 [Chanos chanos]